MSIKLDYEKWRENCILTIVLDCGSCMDKDRLRTMLNASFDYGNRLGLEIGYRKGINDAAKTITQIKGR